MPNYNSSSLSVNGVYTGHRPMKFDIRIQPATDDTPVKFGVLNEERSIVLSTSNTSTLAYIKSDDGIGTYTTGAEALYIGDHLSNISGADALLDSGTTIAAIVQGTEGYDVQRVTLSTAAVATGTSEVKYTPAQITITNHEDHRAVEDSYTNARLHGLTFYFTESLNGTPMATNWWKIWQFMAFPSGLFKVDVMTRLVKDSKHSILGWNTDDSKLYLAKDIYNKNVTSESSTDYSLGEGFNIENKPTFVTRGDDTYIGTGSGSPSLYVGYPQLEQFGTKVGSELVIDNSNPMLDFTSIPKFEDFVFPVAAGTATTNLVLALTTDSTLVVGYVRGSKYLIKATIGSGVVETFNVGGKICAIRLDREDTNNLWVVYSTEAQYKIKKFDVNAQGTAMAIADNYVFTISPAADQYFPTASSEESKITSIEVLDGHIYLAASDAKFDYKPISQCTYTHMSGVDKKNAFIWRIEPPGSIGSIPSIGYTLLVPTNITPALTTGGSNGEATNVEGDAFWFTWRQREWELEGEGGDTGGHVYDQIEFRGDGTEDFRLEVAPIKRSLCVWSTKAGTEAIAMYIGYTKNTGDDMEPIMYSQHENPDGSTYHTEYKYKMGPFIWMKHKYGGSGTGDSTAATLNKVKLGSHLMIFGDSEAYNGASPDGVSTSYTGITRVPVNDTSVGIGDTVNFSTTSDDNNDIVTGNFFGSFQNMSADSVVTGEYRGGSHAASDVNYPRGFGVTSGSSLFWWDLPKVEDSVYRYKIFLNRASVDTWANITTTGSSVFKEFNQLSTDNISEAVCASQIVSYSELATALDKLAICFPQRPTEIRYISNPVTATVTDEFSEVEIKKGIKISVTHLTSGLEDINNLLPDSVVAGGASDTEYEDADFYSNFYKISVMYDGFQESVLSSSIYSSAGAHNPKSFGHKITLEVLPNAIPKRLSHINIYRGRARDNESIETDDSQDFLLVKSLPLGGKGWIAGTGGYIKYELSDNTGANFGSYESLTGISPAMPTNALDYGISTECAGYLFVTNALNKEISNVDNYIFRSKAGKYSIFNWANEYVALPEKVNALRGYNNFLYAFSSSTVYTINPNNLSIIDSMNGQGALNSDSVISTDYGMFFSDKYGAYIHNGRASQLISGNIYDSDNTDLTNLDWKSIDWESNPAKVAFDSQRKAVLFLFIYNSASYAWVYSVLLKRWDLWSFVLPIRSIVNGQFGEILASDGKLLQIGTGTTRKAWEFQSKKITAGFDTYEKQFKEIQSESESFTVASCQMTTGDATIIHPINAEIVAGLGVSGTGIPSGATIDSITSNVNFELSEPATATHNSGSGSPASQTLTFSVGIKYKTGLASSSWNSLSSNRLSSSNNRSKWLQIQAKGIRKLESLGIHLRPLKARSTKI